MSNKYTEDISAIRRNVDEVLIFYDTLRDSFIYSSLTRLSDYSFDEQGWQDEAGRMRVWRHNWDTSWERHGDKQLSSSQGLALQTIKENLHLIHVELEETQTVIHGRREPLEKTAEYQAIVDSGIALSSSLQEIPARLSSLREIGSTLFRTLKRLDLSLSDNASSANKRSVDTSINRDIRTTLERHIGETHVEVTGEQADLLCRLSSSVGGGVEVICPVCGPVSQARSDSNVADQKRTSNKNSSHNPPIQPSFTSIPSSEPSQRQYPLKHDVSTASAASQALSTSSDYSEPTPRQERNYIATAPAQQYGAQQGPSRSNHSSTSARLDFPDPPAPANTTYTSAQSRPEIQPAAPTGPASTPRSTQASNRRPSVTTNTLPRSMNAMTLQEQPPAAGPARPPHNPIAISPQVTVRDGHRYVNVQDPSSEVRTFFQTAPVSAITDPVLLKRGIQATRRLLATDNEIQERLFDSFRRRDQPRKFFITGRIFLVLWVQPAGEPNTPITQFESGTSLGRHAEKVFSKVRRFIVIREAESYCTCLPITTYGRHGVGEPGVKKSEHSIIHTTSQAPEPLHTELPGRNEEGMRPQAVRAHADDPIDKLDDLSRIDYGTVYTVQHNVKVKNFGKVHVSSMNAFVHQFGNVWNSQPVIGQQLPSRELSEASAPVAAQRDTRSQLNRDLTRLGLGSGPRDTGEASKSSKLGGSGKRAEAGDGQQRRESARRQRHQHTNEDSDDESDETDETDSNDESDDDSEAEDTIESHTTTSQAPSKGSSSAKAPASVFGIY